MIDITIKNYNFIKWVIDIRWSTFVCLFVFFFFKINKLHVHPMGGEPMTTFSRLLL